MIQSDLDFIAPYVNGSATSREAAESMHDHVSRLEGIVLAAIKHTGGATCDEIEIMCGLKHQTASARCRGLFLKGRIVDSGTKRPTRSGRSAVVWVSSTPVIP